MTQDATHDPPTMHVVVRIHEFHASLSGSQGTRQGSVSCAAHAGREFSSSTRAGRRSLLQASTVLRDAVRKQAKRGFHTRARPWGIQCTEHSCCEWWKHRLGSIFLARRHALPRSCYPRNEAGKLPRRGRPTMGLSSHCGWRDGSKSSDPPRSLRRSKGLRVLTLTGPAKV